MTTAVINIEQLSKVYPRTLTSGAFNALKGVSFQVHEGEAFGFIGANGAGKSTTIKILTGAMRASGGQAQLFGLPVSDCRSRVGLGYVPESPSLPDYLTPTEVLEMGIALHGLKIENPSAHIHHWLERFEIAHVAKKTIRSFSKGMTQRVALAQALSVQPKLLILDEPLSGLDPVGRHEVVNILAEYSGQGGTLFFTSHVLHDVERLAHRYGLIHKGELSAVRSPAELAGENDLVTIRSLGDVPVEGFTREVAGRWFAEISRNSVWNYLEQLRAAGHIVVEVRPTLSLESAFMRAIGTHV